MFLTIIAFIIILGLLVLIHELGHFATARFFKTRVEEFGLGYPPRIIGTYQDNNGKRKWIVGKKPPRSASGGKSEEAPSTIYSLNYIPIGGFVKIKGENEVQLKEPDSFGAKKLWQRAIMLVSGVSMNVVLCILLLSIGFGFGIPSVLNEQIIEQATSIKDIKIQIVSINKNSPAEKIDLQIGDSINSIDGEPVTSIDFVQNYLARRENQEVVLEIMRSDKRIILEAAPQIMENTDNRAVLGIGLVKTGIVTYPWYMSLWQGIKATYYLLITLILAFYELIKNIISTGEVAAELAGPIGIAVLTGQVVNMGFVYVLQFTALLSLNLAIINILPIPALDGGRLLFLIIEKIRGKEVNQKIEALVHNIGFVILMVLVVLVTYRDVARWGGQILSHLSF